MGLTGMSIAGSGMLGSVSSTRIWRLLVALGMGKEAGKRGTK